MVARGPARPVVRSTTRNPANAPGIGVKIVPLDIPYKRGSETKTERSVYAEERLQQIIERARARGRVRVTDLARDLTVTPETIRRDLTGLERQGLLRRVHGHAISVSRLGFEREVSG